MSSRAEAGSTTLFISNAIYFYSNNIFYLTKNCVPQARAAHPAVPSPPGHGPHLWSRRPQPREGGEGGVLPGPRSGTEKVDMLHVGPV